MATLRDRAPRLDFSCPLTFRLGTTVTHGHCLNLSQSGLLGLFDEPLELWTEGELLLRLGELACALQVRVARTSEREAGLAFCFRSVAEREQVQAILESAASRTHLVGQPPF